MLLSSFKDAYRDSFKDALNYLSLKECPVDSIRIKFIIGTHFIERLFERISVWPIVRKDILDWIDKEYCILLYESNLTPEVPVTKKVYFEKFDSTVILILFQRKISLRTCYRGKDEN